VVKFQHGIHFLAMFYIKLQQLPSILKNLVDETDFPAINKFVNEFNLI